MKKNFLNLVVLATVTVSSFAWFACDDNSGESKKTSVTLPATASEAAALVNAVYGPLQTLSSSYSFLVESATETTVCFEEKDETKDGPQVSIFETENSNWYPIKVFNRLYTSIGAANLAIERISAATQLHDTVKSNYIAQAKFVRGYDYFQLVQLFGEVPLILSSSASDADRTTRRSIDDVYAQVDADLTDAINTTYLTQYSATKSNPSQLAAKTILAKAYLTWGQKPLSQSEVEAIKTAKTDPAKPAVDQTKLQKALSYANEVINSGKYKLQGDFNDIWGVGNENNAEVIFSIQHYGDGIDAQGNHQTHCGYTWPKDERADPHIQWADISYENILTDDDARKPFSFAKYTRFKDGEIDTLTWPLSVVRPGKWIHRDGEYALPNQPNNIDHIDFRLGEVYLIKAEAENLLNTGDKGLAAINTLRTRAGIDTYADIDFAKVQQEWLNELAFEQKHWLNLVRWRTLIKSVAEKVPTYEYYKDVYNDQAAFEAYSYNGIPADPTRFAFYKRIYKHLRGKVQHIDGHFYRFPIPLSESYTDLGINGQNPGY